jgi:hypothetical protein
MKQTLRLGIMESQSPDLSILASKRPYLIGTAYRSLRKSLVLVVIAVLMLSLSGIAWRAGVLSSLIGHFMIPQAAPPVLPIFSDITMPFELVNEHIFIPATLNGSRPLAFLLDTGDKFGIIDLELAKELNVSLGGNISVHGVGPKVTTGVFVKETSFTLPGFPGFSQPVTLAIPLRNLATRLGHDLDGIIGSEFIKQFVLELDYQKCTITLHNQNKFSYSGSGESVPIHLTSSGHPVLRATITLAGGNPIDADVELDTGASGALELHSQFVTSHHLPGPNARTIRDIGASGTGGESQGRVGRMAAFRMGKYELREPLTVFSSDTAGNAAGSDSAGSIGEEILERFKLFFDYGHNRIIFEPNSAFANAFDPAFSGLHLEAEGKDYKTFRIKEVLEDTPGTEAGLQRGDVITAVDGKSAADLTYTALLEMFKRAATFKLTINRAGQTLNINLTPRKLV